MRSTIRTPLAALLSIITLIGSTAVMSTFPSAGDVVNDSHERHGVTNERIALRAATIRILGATTSSRIRNCGRSCGGNQWIAVSYVLTASTTTLSPGRPILSDARGRRYTSNPYSTSRVAYPGVPVSGTAVFEVPADALEGHLTFYLGTGRQTSGDNIAVVELPAPTPRDEIVVADAAIVEDGDS